MGVFFHVIKISLSIKMTTVFFFIKTCGIQKLNSFLNYFLI